MLLSRHYWCNKEERGAWRCRVCLCKNHMSGQCPVVGEEQQKKAQLWRKAVWRRMKETGKVGQRVSSEYEGDTIQAVPRGDWLAGSRKGNARPV